MKGSLSELTSVSYGSKEDLEMGESGYPVCPRLFVSSFPKEMASNIFSPKPIPIFLLQ
jgi:hypothetical protein